MKILSLISPPSTILVCSSICLSPRRPFPLRLPHPPTHSLFFALVFQLALSHIYLPFFWPLRCDKTANAVTTFARRLEETSPGGQTEWSRDRVWVESWIPQWGRKIWMLASHWRTTRRIFDIKVHNCMNYYYYYDFTASKFSFLSSGLGCLLFTMVITL